MSDGVPAPTARVFEPLTALTWNISHWAGTQRISARAPANSGERVAWSVENNFAAVQMEILRYDAGVVSLQECPSADPLCEVVKKYRFVGAEESHAGFVHLYVSLQQVEPVRIELPPPVPAVACRLEFPDVVLTFVALHLPRCG